MKKLLVPFCMLAFIFLSCQKSNYFGTLDTILPQKENSLKSDPNWFREVVFYHIWVKSFADSNGDEIGDLNGIRQKLDYLQDLGVGALWLSPIFVSKNQSNPYGNMHGYDTIDFFNINPYFGSKEELAQLLQEAHAKNIRIIFDFVPNHISDRHSWFLKFLENDKEYKDFFIYSKERKKFQTQWYPLPNTSNMEGYYYGFFSPEMPDLNYNNQEVRKRMANTLLYWLNFGFDGVRIDAAKYLFEDFDKGKNENLESTFDFYTQLTKHVVTPFSQLGYTKFSVAEVWDGLPNIVKYLDTGIDSAFDFEFSQAVKNSIKNGRPIFLKQHFARQKIIPEAKVLSNFLSNHDNLASRPMTNYDKDISKVKLAAAINILIGRLPFIYYGNEIGMEGKMGNDINLRTPYNWTEWLNQKDDSTSLVNTYKKLIHMRNNYKTLRLANPKVMNWGNPILAVQKKYEGSTIWFIANLDNEDIEIIKDLPLESGTSLSRVLAVSSESVDADILDTDSLKLSLHGYEWVLIEEK